MRHILDVVISLAEMQFLL